jgi:superoxide dismutase
MHEFTRRAQSLPHKGWALLAADGKDLSIVTLPDHETETELNPLLLVNMWDYAYRYDYADAQSYLRNIWRVIDWHVVEQRFTNN